MNERQLFLNGASLQTRSDTLQALLLEHGFSLGAAFACAINNQFVPRTQWQQHALQTGDRVDVIAPITGG